MTPRALHLSAALCAAMLTTSASCSKKNASNEDLKAQILSSEPGPIVLPPLAINAAALHEDKLSLQRVMAPQSRDLEKRLAAFSVKLKQVIEGPQPIGVRSYEHSWRRAPSGAFTVRHSSGLDNAEWIVTDSDSYVRHGKGDWRKKPHTIEHAEVLKRDVVIGLSELYTLFGEALTASPPKPTTDNGREAWRYTLQAKADGAASDGAKTGDGGARNLLRDDVEAISLSGDIVVDKATGALLTAALAGSFALRPLPESPRNPALEEGKPSIIKLPAQTPIPVGPTAITLKLTYELTIAAGKDTAAALEPRAPEGAKIDAGFERPPADYLGFWLGAGHGKGDGAAKDGAKDAAKTPAKGAGASVEDEEEEEEATKRGK